MEVKVLGCSGGIGGDRRTTSMLVDQDILIDAGTGVGDLSLEELAKIDHIFVTHSHLDHVCCIPLLLDSVMGIRNAPVTVHATAETWQALKDHIFNWKIWPDFTVIPSPESPILNFEPIEVGQTTTLSGRKFTALPANHVVPTIGILVDSGRASLAFTSDTTSCDALWESLNKVENLKHLIIETAFCDADLDVARASKHLSPKLLEAELRKLTGSPEVCITHLKPGSEASILEQVNNFSPRREITQLTPARIYRL